MHHHDTEKRFSNVIRWMNDFNEILMIAHRTHHLVGTPHALADDKLLFRDNEFFLIRRGGEQHAMTAVRAITNAGGEQRISGEAIIAEGLFAFSASGFSNGDANGADHGEWRGNLPIRGPLISIFFR